MSKKGMKKTDWRESSPRPKVPRMLGKKEREEEIDGIMKATAPSQKEYRSKEAEEGKRISPFWMPDDIGTENFSKSTGTAYLRRME